MLMTSIIKIKENIMNLGVTSLNMTVIIQSHGEETRTMLAPGWVNRSLGEDQESKHQPMIGRVELPLSFLSWRSPPNKDNEEKKYKLHLQQTQ